MSYLVNFSNDTAKQILIEIIRTVNQPENSKKLSEAKASAGKEMLLMMQHVFPLVMQLQTDVIKTYGFPGNREGLVQFSQLVREMEREDVEIARLRSQIRAIYLPPIAINTTNDILIWAKIISITRLKPKYVLTIVESSITSVKHNNAFI